MWARIDVQTLDAGLSEDDLNREERRPRRNTQYLPAKRRPKVDDRRSRPDLSSWLQGRSRHRPGVPRDAESRPAFGSSPGTTGLLTRSPISVRRTVPGSARQMDRRARRGRSAEARHARAREAFFTRNVDHYGHPTAAARWTFLANASSPARPMPTPIWPTRPATGASGRSRSRAPS